MSEIGFVLFEDTAISFQIRRSTRRKTICLKVTSEGVILLAPPTISLNRLQELVSQKGAWILEKQALVKRPLPRQWKSGESISLLDEKYILQRVPQQNTIQISASYLIVPDLDQEQLKAKLIRWYCERAIIHLPERVCLYSQILGLPFPKVLIRDQRKRWGSCNSKGELRFNWRIMMAPSSLVDYVVAHEVCHLIHMNHSPAFWQQLQKLVPDGRERHRRLAQLAQTLQL